MSLANGIAAPLRLRAPRYGLDLTFELLPELAPRTVAALLAALPAVGLVTTESHYGSNVCLRVPGLTRPQPAENETIFPIPGDVLVFEGPHGAELVAYYQRMGGYVPAGTPFDGRGARPGTRVGRVTNLDEAARAAATRVWSESAAWGAAGPAAASLMQAVADDRATAAAEIEARCARWRQSAAGDHQGEPARPGRRVRVSIPEYEAMTEVQLAVDLAPETCEHLWNNLPVSFTLMHGRYSGPEVFTNAAEVNQHWNWTARPENHLAYPIPGDLVIYHEPPPRLQLNYFHDRDSIPYGFPRPEAGILIGRSVGDFSQFAEACWRLAYEGWKTIVVERFEP